MDLYLTSKKRESLVPTIIILELQTNISYESNQLFDKCFEFLEGDIDHVITDKYPYSSFEFWIFSKYRSSTRVLRKKFLDTRECIFVDSILMHTPDIFYRSRNSWRMFWVDEYRTFSDLSERSTIRLHDRKHMFEWFSWIRCKIKWSHKRVKMEERDFRILPKHWEILF